LYGTRDCCIIPTLFPDQVSRESAKSKAVVCAVWVLHAVSSCVVYLTVKHFVVFLSRSCNFLTQYSLIWTFSPNFFKVWYGLIVSCKCC